MISDWVLNFEKSPTSPMSPATVTTPKPLHREDPGTRRDPFECLRHLGFYLFYKTVHGLELREDMVYIQDG